MRELGPEHVAPALGIVPPHASHDDHRVDARHGIGRRVSGLLHVDDLPPSVEAIRGDEHLRLRVAQPAGDRVGGVAGEDRDEHRADRADREHGDSALDHEWHEDRDAVALFHAERAKPGPDTRDLPRELRERQAPDRTLLALADDRDAIRLVAERGRDVIHAPAAPPRGPGDPATRVEDVLVRHAPDDPEIALGRAPEAVHVLDGPAQERREVRVTVALGEAPQAASLEICGGRRPGGAHHRHGTRGSRPGAGGQPRTGSTSQSRCSQTIRE